MRDPEFEDSLLKTARMALVVPRVPSTCRYDFYKKELEIIMFMELVSESPRGSR